MITDVTKLPPLIECDGCKLMFTSGSFLWHNCGDPSDHSDPFADDEEEGESEESDQAEQKVLGSNVPQRVATVPIPELFERLPFKFLPPEHGDVVDQLRTHLRRTRSGHFSREIDWERLYRLQKSCKASLLALGEDGWWGYAVFKTPREGRFLLESVIFGNAAYVIDGDWREAIHYSKAEIRDEYRQRHKRIIHTGDWISRIQAALSQKTLRR